LRRGGVWPAHCCTASGNVCRARRRIFWSFLAAIIAAVAGAAGWIYQYRNEVAKEQRAYKSEKDRNATFIHSYLLTTKTYLERTRKILNAVAYNTPAGQLPSPSDLTIAHAGTIRSVIPSVFSIDTEQLLIQTQVFGADLGLEIIDQVEKIALSTGSWRFDLVQDAQSIPRSIVDSGKGMLIAQLNATNAVIVKTEAVLKQRGLIT
jgi:hypothetical protein